MTILQDIQELAVKKRVPVIQTGHTVRVHQKIKEGEKERIQIFEGLVIRVNSGHGADKTFTVRKIVQGIGVEKIFPLYSPNIQKIEVKKESKVRRAKLYYMRERAGKSARLKESFVSEEEMEHAVEELAIAAAQSRSEDAESQSRSEAEAHSEEKAQDKSEEPAPVPKAAAPAPEESTKE